MRLSPTLSLYIARHFLAGMALVLLVLVGLIAMIDFVELLRRSNGR
jgi:lipopolysaccharide export system permease protein